MDINDDSKKKLSNTKALLQNLVEYYDTFHEVYFSKKDDSATMHVIGKLYVMAQEFKQTVEDEEQYEQAMKEPTGEADPLDKLVEASMTYARVVKELTTKDTGQVDQLGTLKEAELALFEAAFEMHKGRMK